MKRILRGLSGAAAVLLCWIGICTPVYAETGASAGQPAGEEAATDSQQALRLFLLALGGELQGAVENAYAGEEWIDDADDRNDAPDAGPESANGADWEAIAEYWSGLARELNEELSGDVRDWYRQLRSGMLSQEQVDAAFQAMTDAVLQGHAGAQRWLADRAGALTESLDSADAWINAHLSNLDAWLASGTSGAE